MARITAIINQKGGVGKTATAAALLAGTTARGYKALAIDADAQGNLTYITQAKPRAGLYDAMKGADVSGIIQETAQGFIIPATAELYGADVDFTKTGRGYLTREALAPVKGQYDYIFIDCPPHLGIITVNALTAADDVIIPLTADILSLQGLGQLYDTIKQVKKYCNPSLQIAGLLLTRYTKRAAISRDVAAVIKEQAAKLETVLYNAYIREGVAVREAHIMRKSIFETHPKANATADYNAFIEEYIKQEEKKQ